MNFYDMRLQFDRVQRTLTDTTFSDYRDDYLNMGWARISEMFLIPGLKRKVDIDAVADQNLYLFPYDYNGAEVYLYYKTSSDGSYNRLDPVTEEALALSYERRSGSMGRVEYYDWTRNVGSDLASGVCALVNNSATVACAMAAAAHADRWIRFDPFVSGSATYNPGDYGYLISSVTAGVSYTLDRAYRGPAGFATGRIRPAEQAQFIVYGTPDAALTDAFQLLYYAKPHRLYNDADVPEWPSMDMAIVSMAVSMGYDFIHDTEAAKTWFGRAMSHVTGLQRRLNVSKANLVRDLTIGSISGRQVGLRGINDRRVGR